MVKLKVNKDTGKLYELNVTEDEITKSKNFSEKYRGFVMIFNTEKSFVAKKIEKVQKGFYAIDY